MLKINLLENLKYYSKKGALLLLTGALSCSLAACQPKTNAPKPDQTTSQSSVGSANSENITSSGSSLSADVKATNEATSEELEAEFTLPGPVVDTERVAAPLKAGLSEDGKVHIQEFDLGNIEQDGYNAPCRGLFIVPKAVEKPLPLLVFSHLRAPNCEDLSFAFPCPVGEGLRFDRGMAYLGEALAEAGYAVLIPDLTPLWVSDHPEEPYDQVAMWEKILGRMWDSLKADQQGESQNFGLELSQKLNLEQVGLMVHSRSSMMIPAAQQLFGEKALCAVLAYGPSYASFAAEEADPPAPDIPYLIINGDADRDVKVEGNLWLSQHIQVVRHQPLIALQVPGFGHMFINRTLQTPELDDRIHDERIELPTAADHEKFLLDMAKDWFGTMLYGKESTLPLANTDLIPQTYTSQKVRWLLATPGENVLHLKPQDFKPLPGKKAEVCTHAQPMNPFPPKDACPEPDLGLIRSISPLLHFNGASTQVEIKAPQAMAIHLLPWGSTGLDGEVTVHLDLASGKSWEKTFSGKDYSALANRQTKLSNGEYLISTLRIDLSELTGETIAGISLESGELPLELRGVDVVFAD